MARSGGRPKRRFLLFRQIYALVVKNLIIAFVRRPITTPLRALVLPLAFGWFIAYARNFFVPPAVYGFGSPQPIRELSSALSKIDRERLVFVDNGFKGGEIERVINIVSDAARGGGKEIKVVTREDDLLTVCKSTLWGTTNCVAGVVFYSSPTEPEDAGVFNYTMYFDGSLGPSIDVSKDTNDGELFVIPLQRAIDSAILEVNSTSGSAKLQETEEYPFTSLTQEERAERIRKRYNGALVNILAVAFFIGICGIQYQQVGAQATERETRMSQLVEVMMPNRRRWEPQVARLASYHIAFTMLYLPGWIGMTLIIKYGVFANTSLAIVLITHILIGLSLASFSLFGAAFFKRAQLSGITVILVSLALAIVAQLYDKGSEVIVIVCSLLFPSMCYTYLIVLIARFEQQGIGASLTEAAPDDLWGLPGIVLWAFLVIQILVYPILGALVERWLWGTTSSNRQLIKSDEVAVELKHLSKRFTPSWFAKHIKPLFGKDKRETVLAVDDLSLEVRHGQISVLLGANGCGKSTTLDAIAGLSKPTAGTISIDARKGLGLCPQQNVHWKDLTVSEHIKIFDMIKATGKPASAAERTRLIDECDLREKMHFKASSLSGGQMRKLQLASMFSGGSQICLVDECSSGIDPIARRKIQNILLEERVRSNRTMIFTSHYLDEAEIADYILIMSKGQLKIQGTAPEIKQRGQYEVHVYHGVDKEPAPLIEGFPRREIFDQVIYAASNASEAATIIAELEKIDYRDYTVSGPTVEDAFMQVSEEMKPALEHSSNSADKVRSPEKAENSEVGVEGDASGATSEKSLKLSTGAHIGPFQQGIVLFRKRLRVFARNVLPNLTAFLLLIVAAALAGLYLNNFSRAGCTPTDQVDTSDVDSLSAQLQKELQLVVGPPSKLNISTFELILSTLQPPTANASGSGNGSSPSSNFTGLINSIHMVDTLDDFTNYIHDHYHNVTPGGFFIGEGSQPSTMAWRGNGAIEFPIFIQNFVDIITTGIPITTQYSYFNIPWRADQGDSLQFVVYFALIVSVAPGFFALYPTMERLRHVRALHYSNGVRALPLWLAYTSFDFLFVLAGASLAVGILAAAYSTVWFSIVCFWLVLVLFLLCATLFAYIISLFAQSQLGAFAVSSAYQAVSSLLYMIAYLSCLTYSPPNDVDYYLRVTHFTLAIVFPSASMLRGLFVGLNILSTNCRGLSDYVASPADITAYGGPIVFLVVQSLLQFVFLIWWESGNNFNNLFDRGYRASDTEEKHAPDQEVLDEVERVSESTSDGLRVLHLTKAYGRTLAVDDTTFGVKRGEVFGLLGPNGAGKSTTISAIRGDLKPSTSASDIFIENISLRKKKAVARQHLSACPQHDAMDRLTVTEHLKFYARIRGIREETQNVEEVIRAVGLTKFKNRMGDALSGGNKRKLSLGIALMGNPAVMLLDEPSSGMDVAAKRVMWRTLEAVVPGRSIVLTTHSMEEADRLCSRAGILATRMLAIGTCDYLRKKHGDRYYVHLLLSSAPYTEDDEAARVRAFIEDGNRFPGAQMEGGIFHGQVRFSVPVGSTDAPRAATALSSRTEEEHFALAPETQDDVIQADSARSPTPLKTRSPIPPSAGGVGALFAALEKSKEELGFEYYSVSQTSLDQVFLSIVGKHNVEEEGMGTKRVPTRRWWKQGVAG